MVQGDQLQQVAQANQLVCSAMGPCLSEGVFSVMHIGHMSCNSCQLDHDNLANRISLLLMPVSSLPLDDPQWSLVIAYGQSGFLCLDWGEFSQKFAVPQCGSARSIHFDQVLIELSNFNDQTSLVPFGGVEASLVLYPDMITDSEWW